MKKAAKIWKLAMVLGVLAILLFIILTIHFALQEDWWRVKICLGSIAFQVFIGIINYYNFKRLKARTE